MTFEGSCKLHFIQDQKTSVKDESLAASKNNLPSKGTQQSSKTAGISSAGPVTEEEIRAVLMQMTPVTAQDLVAKFKARLRCPEVRFVMFYTNSFSLFFLMHILPTLPLTELKN